MATKKTRQIQIVLNLPVGSVSTDSPSGLHNVEYSTMLAYYDYIKREFVYVDEFDNIKRANHIEGSTKVKRILIEPRNPSITISVKEDAPELENTKKNALIDFYYNWPLVAHALPNGSLSSFPTKNHQLHFLNVYSNSPDTILPMSSQPFKLVDNQKIEKVKNENLKNDMELIKQLNILESTPENLEKLSYMIGLNPKGLEVFEIQNKIFEYVKTEGTYDSFNEIIKNKLWNSPVDYLVAIGILEGIIVTSDSGVYQYDGRSIANNKADLVYYFSANEEMFNMLRLNVERLGIIVNVPDEAIKPNKTRGAKKQVEARQFEEIDVADEVI